MADASEFHFYSRLFTDLSTALTDYVSNTATSVIGAIKPVAITLVTIYVMLWGWSMMRGVISEPIMDGIGRIVRLAVITGIALELGQYNAFLVDLLWHSPDALASYVTGGDGTTNTAAFLDDLMEQIYDFGDAFYQKALAEENAIGIPDMGLLMTALAIWLVGVIATGYGAFLLALSKMGLAVALGVGPIFILLMIFEPTKRFFDAWMGQALNYVFLVMLAAGTIKLILTILKTYLTISGPDVMADPSLNQALPAIVFSLVGALVLVQMPSMASALGGGVAIGTLGAVNWAYGKTKGTMSKMRPTNLRRSYNRARADLHVAGNAAKSVASAPMAVYRKITGGQRNRVAHAN
ncbi:MAG: type IV secretion system protein [Azoarcus sp.]|nr:type IV secretion system protein [Azoarcus sp.]